MARRNRSSEEIDRRAKIRELLQMSNISSMKNIQNLFKETIAESMEDGLDAELDDKLGYLFKVAHQWFDVFVAYKSSTASYLMNYTTLYLRIGISCLNTPIIAKINCTYVNSCEISTFIFANLQNVQLAKISRYFVASISGFNCKTGMESVDFLSIFSCEKIKFPKTRFPGVWRPHSGMCIYSN